MVTPDRIEEVNIKFTKLRDITMTIKINAHRFPLTIDRQAKNKATLKLPMLAYYPTRLLFHYTNIAFWKYIIINFTG